MTDGEMADQRIIIEDMLENMKKVHNKVSKHRSDSMYVSTKKTYTLGEVRDVMAWSRLESRLFQLHREAKSITEDGLWKWKGN